MAKHILKVEYKDGRKARKFSFKTEADMRAKYAELSRERKDILSITQEVDTRGKSKTL